jgi:hypothetical protein
MGGVLTPLLGALATAFAGILAAWLFARVRSGRLARTLDQTGKLLDFVERYCAAYESLAKVTEAKRADVESILVSAAQAVREDLAAERAALPEFEKRNATRRSALLLRLPDRNLSWLPFIVFHTALLFIFYVAALRTFRHDWSFPGDVYALLIAASCAMLARLAAGLIPART